MFIVSTGMVCSVGLSAAAACAAMRAGIAKFDELPYRDNQGEPIIGAMVPGLDPSLKRGPRLLEMLARALTDCLGENPSIPTARVPLLVGLAEEGRPGGGAALAGTIVKDIQDKLKLRFRGEYSRAIPKGHTAGCEGLRIVRELFEDPDVPACVVCGVDSYINASSLLWLDKHLRLKTPAIQHGVIPGEAAAAILLQRTPANGAVMEVIGLGFDMEEAHVLSDKPLLGLGLTEAARAALAESKLAFHEIDWRLSDVTGEQYGFKELSLIGSRLARVVRNGDQLIWHCSDSMGDSGAAAGTAQLVMAEKAFRKGYAPGKKAICLSSSVPGDRAAVVIRRENR